MPQAVRLLCPWDGHVGALSTWSHANSIHLQSSAYCPGRLISINPQIDEVPAEHMRTGAVPAGLWPLFAFTHRLRGGLIMFRPPCRLDACFFDNRHSTTASPKCRASKESSTSSHTNSVAITNKVPAVKRRNLNSPARKCRVKPAYQESPLRRTAPQREPTR